MSSHGQRIPGGPPLHYPSIRNQSTLNPYHVGSGQAGINYPPNLRDHNPLNYPPVRDPVNYGGLRDLAPINYQVREQGPVSYSREQPPVFPRPEEQSSVYPGTETAVNYSTMGEQQQSGMNYPVTEPSAVSYPSMAEHGQMNYPKTTPRTAQSNYPTPTQPSNFKSSNTLQDKATVNRPKDIAGQQQQKPASINTPNVHKPDEHSTTSTTAATPTNLKAAQVIAQPPPSVNTENKIPTSDRPVKKRKISNDGNDSAIDTGAVAASNNVSKTGDSNSSSHHPQQPSTSKQAHSSPKPIASSSATSTSATNNDNEDTEEDESDEFPWLPCKNLPDDLKDENYFPNGEIMVNCDSDPGMEAFDDHIIKFMKANKIPGLSLCVSRKRAILYTQCYGWAGKDKRLEPSNMFRIASVSKVLTALGILHLCDNGKLRIATKVFGDKGIFSELNPTKKGDKRLYNITVKMLLQHSAGWDRNIAGDPIYYKHVGKEMGVEEPVQPMDLLKYMMGQKLQFNPASKSVYSNFGYLILGLIIERISGESYEKYITDLMDYASLMGMCQGRSKREDKHTLEVDYFSGPRARQVESVFPGGGIVEAPYGGISMETSPATGGWLATPTHLVRLSHAMELGHIIKTTSIRKMKTKPDFSKEDTWYGMGVDVAFNGKEYKHSGHIDGATSILTHSCDGYTWAVCCNYWPADSDYNSVIQYGLCLVKGWTRLTPFITPQFDGATHLGMYAFSLNLTRAQFIQKTKFAFGEGYRIHWINAYTYQKELLFNIIWVIDGKDGRFLFDIDVNTVQEAIAKQKGNGYCPTHLELYVRNNKVLCCIIFLKSGNPVKVVVNQRINHLDEEIQNMSMEGWTPNVVCICPHKREKWVAILYHENPERNWVRFNMPSDQYARTHSKQAHYGHMPIYVRVHQGDNGPLFTAIWENPGPYLFTTQHDMSRFKLLGDFVQVENEDFLPHIIIGYEMEATQRYTGVFVKAVEVGSMANWH